MPRAAAHRWSELEADHPVALCERRRVMGEHCMISHVTLRRGFVVSMHQHVSEQFAVIVSGRMRFTLPRPDGSRDVVVLGPGEVLHLPPDVPHEGEALEDSIVLDIFSPPSERTGVDAQRKR